MTTPASTPATSTPASSRIVERVKVWQWAIGIVIAVASGIATSAFAFGAASHKYITREMLEETVSKERVLREAGEDKAELRAHELDERFNKLLLAAARTNERLCYMITTNIALTDERKLKVAPPPKGYCDP